MMRHATLAVASTVGPSVPTTTAEPTGPTHGSIGLSIRSSSVCTPRANQQHIKRFGHYQRGDDRREGRVGRCDRRCASQNGGCGGAEPDIIFKAKRGFRVA